ncbi:nucleoside hydrolase [Nocardia sp. NPDC047654]|uniref:nucleoside hydrolase n=1 Tax=Nocardia sp. NPDC047654 TaxID=3364314 RepID=UPI003717AFF8
MDGGMDWSEYERNPFPLGSGMEGLERRSVDWPEPSSMPLILDTDIGGEPDDALALAVAAGVPALSLVITSDEYGDRRARLARCLLDLMGRSDVPVVAGADLGNDHSWTVEGMVPDRIGSQPRDVSAAVAKVLERSGGPVGWVGLGPMSNLARLLQQNPAIGDRLVVTQQEGASNFAEQGPHRNIELDMGAARYVFASGIHPWIVSADISFHPLNALTKDSIEYEVLKKGIDPARNLLRIHLDLWFNEFSRYVTLHGPITLAQSIGMPFLAATPADTALDDDGRLTHGNSTAYIAQSADYDEFRRWLVNRLERVESKLVRHPAADYSTDV